MAAETTEASTATGTTEDRAQAAVVAAQATLGALISSKAGRIGARMAAGMLLVAVEAGSMKAGLQGEQGPLMLTPVGVAAVAVAIMAVEMLLAVVAMATVANAVAVMSLVSSSGKFLQALAATMPSLA